MTISNRTTFAGVLVLATLLASQASASRIASDTPKELSVDDACSIGGDACAASALGIGFSNLDSALAGNVYVYDSGIVSLNAPLPDGADPANAATLGTAFLAPGLLQTGSYSVSTFFPGPDEYDPYGSDPGSLNNVFILFGTGSTLFGVDIEDDGPANATSLSSVKVSYAYGADGPFPSDTNNYPSPTLPSGAVIGYNIGGQRYWMAAPNDPGLYDYGGTFNLALTAPPTAPMPEPGTWALMLAGVGLVGAQLRRRPRVTVAAT